MSSKKIIMISGVEGQDGSLLADYLLDLNYKVVGITRRSGTRDLSINLNQARLSSNFSLEYGDITDEIFIRHAISKYQPYIYFNLAAMSHVGHSFQEPSRTFATNAVAVIYALEAIRKESPKTRFYQASTSEMFGANSCPLEGFNESSHFYPRSPYAVSKVAAYHTVINYRDMYNLFAVNGIMFNHSSIRRGYDFATRKITMGLAKVKLGLEQKIKMGNLAAFRDESHAKDMIKAMLLITQAEKPSDYVVASGQGATIHDMFQYVCELAELNMEDVYCQDIRFLRPSDVPYLKGNSSKIQIELGWQPTYSWKDLLKEMYFNDLAILQKSRAGGE